MEKHEGMMHNLVATDFRGQVPFSKDSRDPLISTDLYILLLKKESRPVGTENNSDPPRTAHDAQNEVWLVFSAQGRGRRAGTTTRALSRRSQEISGAKFSRELAG